MRDSLVFVKTLFFMFLSVYRSQVCPNPIHDATMLHEANDSMKKFNLSKCNDFNHCC